MEIFASFLRLAYGSNDRSTERQRRETMHRQI
jgi:hypothetical protein